MGTSTDESENENNLSVAFQTLFVSHIKKKKQGIRKNIGGYNKKPVKQSSYSRKNERLSVFSFTEVIRNLHRYISINVG